MHNKHKCCTPMLLSGILFVLMALLHVLRVAMNWHITLDGTVIPTWPSIIAIIIGALMAIWNFRCCKCCCPACKVNKEEHHDHNHRKDINRPIA